MDRVARRTRARTGVALIACVACLAGAGCSREPTTPEAKRQRGDEIVRRMSDHLAHARTFAVETTDVRTRARGGKEITVRTTRRLTLRRPDRLAFNVTGDMDLRGWYDGSKLTFVADQAKGVGPRQRRAHDRRHARPAGRSSGHADADGRLPVQLAVRVADRHEVERRLRRPRDDRRRALPSRRLHAPGSRLGSLGRRTGRSAAEEVPRHQPRPPLTRGRRRSCSTSGRSVSRRPTRRSRQTCRRATSASRSWWASPRRRDRLRPRRCPRQARRSK